MISEIPLTILIREVFSERMLLRLRTACRKSGTVFLKVSKELSNEISFKSESTL